MMLIVFFPNESLFLGILVRLAVSKFVVTIYTLKPKLAKILASFLTLSTGPPPVFAGDQIGVVSNILFI